MDPKGRIRNLHSTLHHSVVSSTEKSIAGHFQIKFHLFTTHRRIRDHKNGTTIVCQSTS